MSHTGFIIGAYVAAAIIVVAMIGWVFLDAYRLRRDMAALESRGARRRSAGGSGRRAAS